MVQEAPKEHGAVLAFCTACGAAYLLSDERPYSPCHGTEPILRYDLESLFDLVNALGERVLAANPPSEHAPAGGAELTEDLPDQDAPPESPAAAADEAAAPPSEPASALPAAEAKSAGVANSNGMSSPRRRSPRRPKVAAGTA